MSHFQCSHCGAKIPERGYTCQMCGKVCREKVAGAAPGGKRMVISGAPDPGARKPAASARPGKVVKPAPDADPPPLPPKRKAEKMSGELVLPGGITKEAAGPPSRQGAAMTVAPVDFGGGKPADSPAGRDENSELWRELSHRGGEPPARPAPAPATGGGPSILGAGKAFEIKPLDLFPRPGERTVIGSGGADALDLTRSRGVTVAPLFGPPPEIGSTRGGDPARYRLDFSSSSGESVAGSGAPVPPGKLQADGSFLKLLRAHSADHRGVSKRPVAPGSRAALVACICPNMNAFVASLLADAPEAILVVRAPGGIVTERNGALAALRSALLAYGVVEVALLTHDGCMLEGMTGSDLAGLLRASGHPRAGFPGDLRDAAGAFGHADRALRDACALLERQPAFANVAVHGLHLRASGALAETVDGYRRFDGKGA